MARRGSMIGGWAFIIGFILALVIAIVGTTLIEPWVFFVLAILGLLVGLLNITEREVVPFLVATIAFLFSFSALSNVVTKLAFGWDAVTTFFELMIVFIAPAAGIVALITLMKMAKD